MEPNKINIECLYGYRCVIYIASMCKIRMCKLALTCHRIFFFLNRCGVALDAWMLPLSDEVYPKVHQPLLFINSEKYQWASNILEMKKLNYKGRERKMITIE